MITDMITIEMVREAISNLYRIGSTITEAGDRAAIAMAIGVLEAEIERCEELEQFTNEDIAKVEETNSGSH